MKYILKIIFCFYLISLSSCTDEYEEINEEWGVMSIELLETLKKIGVEKQKFKIATEKINTIVGSNGTILIIPKYSLGERAIIMAMGYDNDKLLFEEQEIKIGEHEHYELNLKEIDVTKLNEKIKKYDGEFISEQK